MDQNAIEELFERNADMRLLELRHSESGRTSGAVRHVSAGRIADGSDSTVALSSAPRLRVSIDTAPKNGVIPGALVGVAIDVFNDGNAPAPETKLLLSLPIETEFRRGTLRVDGREVQAPERLFGDGLPVARLPGGTSAKVIFQLQVLPGLNPLYLQPRIAATGVPVVGTPGVTVKRAAAPGTRTALEPEKPFYEIADDEPEAREPESALPMMPPVIVEEPAPAPTPEPPPAAPADPIAESPPATPPKRARRAVAPAAEPAVAPARAIPTADARMTRYRTLSAHEIAVIDRLFASPSPGIIAHFILISTLACGEPPTGDPDAGYASFLRTDGESLGRALVLTKLGKAIDYGVGQAALDALAFAWEPVATPPTAARRSARRLRRDVSETECHAIAALAQSSKRDPHLRARIALLTLAGATIEGVPRARADECLGALATYRSAVLAWLIPLTIASSAHPAPTLPPPPSNVDAAGKRVVAALHAAYAR